MDAIRAIGALRPVRLDSEALRLPPGPVHTEVLKRATDIVFALAALFPLAVVSLVLLLLNPIFNPGPLFFRQWRMGQGGRAFLMIKFRTMRADATKLRAHDAPLEQDRITPLGAVLRTYRIDELPNFFNVMRGEMSVIGPRPDAVDHACIYAQLVPLYRYRFLRKPGITGLAQVRSGYADSVRAVCRKARYDEFYARRASLGLDLFIVWRTVAVVVSGFGAK